MEKQFYLTPLYTEIKELWGQKHSWLLTIPFDLKIELYNGWPARTVHTRSPRPVGSLISEILLSCLLHHYWLPCSRNRDSSGLTATRNSPSQGGNWEPPRDNQWSKIFCLERMESLGKFSILHDLRHWFYLYFLWIKMIIFCTRKEFINRIGS